MLIDTHCHIHDADYPIKPADVIENAKKSGVLKMICIGTDVISSKRAVEFANNNIGVAYAAVGVHPHDAKNGWSEIVDLVKNRNKSMVAIGEIGLDYHYDYSPRSLQIEVLKSQIELALEYDLPMIFHVREAFDDFWQVYDEYVKKGAKIRGVMHSFTDSPENAQKTLDRGLLIGVNGYSTFIKNAEQQQMFKTLPIEKMIFETDAPYLTPAPFRGKVNEPAFVKQIAVYHALARGVSLDVISQVTTENANQLFGLTK